MKYLISVIFLLISLQSIAGIYMQKEADGDISYSDIPLNNAEPVSLSPGNSLPSTSSSAPATNNTTTTVNTTTTTAVAEQATSVYYNAFAIVSPANNDTIQNQPVISVKVAIDPELREGDTVQVYLDGKAFGAPVAGTTINMTNIERGEHTLSAKLFDNNKQLLKQSDVITIFVHRASANFKAAMSRMSRKAKLSELILH